MLGAKVFLIESLPSILFFQDRAVIAEVEKSLKKLGVEIFTNGEIEKIDKKENSLLEKGLRIFLKDSRSIDADIGLVSIGRTSFIDGLDLEKAGVIYDEKKQILINENMQTNIDHIYAIGDVTGKSLLAHAASHQGMIAAEHATYGRTNHTIDYEKIPSVIFTDPEVASIGLKQKQHLEKDHSLSIGVYPTRALGKSLATKNLDGFFKILADSETKKILGAHIISEDASSLISELSLAIQKNLTIDDIIETIHPHPTYSEGIFEAALIANGTPINYPPIKKHR